MRRRLEGPKPIFKIPSVPRAGTKGRSRLAGSLDVDATDMICRSGERDQMAGNDDVFFFLFWFTRPTEILRQ
jgi:hypothetical protein